MFLFHAGFMGAAFAVLFSGWLVARYARRRRWWLRVHRGLAYGGVFMVFAGFTVMSLGKTGGHFRVPHAWLGAAVLALAVATPVLGNLQFVFREKMRGIRAAHRFSGRVTLGLMGINIFSGLRLAGIL